MPVDSDSRRRLAEAMDERRLELDLRWQDVAAKSGVSLKALLNVRTGDADIRPLTQRGIEDGLQWPQGTIRNILTGGSAPGTDTPSQGQAPSPPPTAEDRQQVVREAEVHLLRAMLAPVIDDVRAYVEMRRRENPSVTGKQLFDDAIAAHIWEMEPVPEDSRIEAVAVRLKLTGGMAGIQASLRARSSDQNGH